MSSEAIAASTIKLVRRAGMTLARLWTSLAGNRARLFMQNGKLLRRASRGDGRFPQIDARGDGEGNHSNIEARQREGLAILFYPVDDLIGRFH
jgi:hypothetical protein